MGAGVRDVNLLRVSADAALDASDVVAVEAPLEIRVRRAPGAGEGATPRTLTLTMRTPGNDEDLAAGYLVAEGVVASWDEIVAVEAEEADRILVSVSDEARLDFGRLERLGTTTSSCGACGKASIDALLPPIRMARGPDALVVTPEALHALPETLRAAQAVFDSTGGLHAAALFSANGTLLDVREDVGRHNAVDKVVGAALRKRHLPASASILLVSGRASFELVQKATMAGIPMLVAVGAPSSLAIELAERSDLTLLGFLRDRRFNVYTSRARIAPPSGAARGRTGASSAATREAGGAR
jgi:FdhD protein